VFDIAEINTDIRNAVEDAKTKVADALESVLPRASDALTALSNNKLAQAALAVEHLSPATLDTLAEFLTKADAEVVKLAGTPEPADVADTGTPVPEPTSDADAVPETAEATTTPAGPSVAGVA
jgi:hypothetical protein